MKQWHWLIILVALAVVLGGASWYVYSNMDRTAPEISFPEHELSFTEGNDKNELLADVSAMDQKDGDVSESLRVQDIIPDNGGTTATVIYVAKDNSNNVATKRRTVNYMELDESADAIISGTTNESLERMNSLNISMLPTGSPKIYLTKYKIIVEQYINFDPLNYVGNIQDDSDDVNALWRNIQVTGSVNTQKLGTYRVGYYVTDADGNRSNIAILEVVVRN